MFKLSIQLACFSFLLSAQSLDAGDRRANSSSRSWNIRSQIQIKLTEKCTNPPVNAGGTRGGITRSLERSLSSEAVPKKINEHFEYFKEVIDAEFALPWGRKSDPSSYEFLKLDPYESAPKLKVWRELGYEWNKGELSSSPNFYELAANIKRLLLEKGVTPQNGFVPALVLYKKVEVFNEKTKKLEDGFEYKFIDPVSEKFPENMNEWHVLTQDTQFNIPFDPIFSAMRAGKFPILDAIHDISHFVAFIRFPELTKGLRKNFEKMSLKDVSLAFKKRQYWLTEAMSIPDPASHTVNLQFLNKFGRSSRSRSPAEISAELSQMNEANLIEYSIESARHIESTLRDVSGGNSSSAEKWYYLAEGFGLKPRDLLNNKIESMNIDRVFEFAETYFNQARVTLSANSKRMTNETATFNFNAFFAAQKLLGLALRQNMITAERRAKALVLLNQFTARTEYLLVNKPFSYEQWTSAFMQPNLSLNDPVAKLFRTVFNDHPLLNTIYLGEGSYYGPLVSKYSEYRIPYDQ
ncbi:hypothetical protein N9D31_02055 [Oligoflexaceae bacterium]|nr:hypothetical protein [Oligoflexaceae bacterium]